MATELEAIRDLLNTYKDMNAPLEEREEARQVLAKTADQPDSILHTIIGNAQTISEFKEALRGPLHENKPALTSTTPELKPLAKTKELFEMQMLFQKIKEELKKSVAGPENDDLKDISRLMINKPDVATEFLKHRTQDIANSLSVARILKTIQITAIHNPLANTALWQMVNGMKSTPQGPKMLSAISQDFKHDSDQKHNVSAAIEPVLQEVNKAIKSAGPPRLEKE